MATIALYAAPGMSLPVTFQKARNSVQEYQKQLFTLEHKLGKVDAGAADLTGVMDSIRASTRLQEEKIESLRTIEKASLEFAAEVQQIDGDVAEVIRQGKEDFYEKFDYLRPESEKTEKSVWEKIKESFQKACEWCKEHWKLVLTVVIVVGAALLSLAFPAFATIALFALKGALSGGLMGGILSMLSGESFLKGFEDGAFMGAVFGALSGAGRVFGGCCKIVDKLGGYEKLKGRMKVIAFVSGGANAVLAGFDTLSLAISMFNPDSAIVKLNQKLHNNFLYNAFQFTVSAIAVFSGSAYKRMLEGKPTCFIAGTMIMTAAGLMAIERIKAGDLVLATSPDTYETTYKKVVETYVRETKNLIHLVIRDGNHTEKLVTTDTHPFYVSGKGFIPATELCVGDELCTARAAGAAKSQGTGIIEKILPEVAREPVKVYNFQVEDLHTYHVGLFGVWVHNACGNRNGSKQTSQNQMQKQVESGKAPKGIDRVDPAHTSSGQPHIHFGDNEAALNCDGTWHDIGKRIPAITSKMKEWILDNGWNLPKG